MKKIIAVIAVSLMLFVVATTASAVPVLTVNGGSCGAWVKTRTNNSTVQFMGWLEGYMSGLAVGYEKNILQGTDSESIFLWMDNYCKANPLNGVADGGLDLFFELVKQKDL